MGDVPAPTNPLLDAAKVNMSHQEMDRLVSELETIWVQVAVDPSDGTSTGVEWLPTEGVAKAICNVLGYEDIPELEDALKGTFVEFLDRLPYVVKRENQEDGKTYMQLKPDPPRDSWEAVRMVVKINSSEDLWRVCYKSPNAWVEIPELEFEILQDGKRHIDSIYNHISAAVHNLGKFVSQSGGMSEVHRQKIMETVDALKRYLDVPEPFTWVVHDPAGMSEFKPMDDVEVTHPDLEAESAAEA
jgi:hypothetical protein